MKTIRRALFAAGVAALSACATGPRAGTPAPDLALPDLSGKTVRLSDLRGSVVLVDFWATWCEPCKDSLPRYAKLYEAKRAAGFVVLGVSVDEPSADLAAFAAKTALPYPILRDPQRQAYAAFGIFELPAAILIGPDGRIVRRWDGFIPVDADEVERAVDALTRKR